MRCKDCNGLGHTTCTTCEGAGDVPDPNAYDVPEGYVDKRIIYSDGAACLPDATLATLAPSLWPDRFCGYVLRDEAGVFCKDTFPLWTACEDDRRVDIQYVDPGQREGGTRRTFARAKLIAVRLLNEKMTDAEVLAEAAGRG